MFKRPPRPPLGSPLKKWNGTTLSGHSTKLAEKSRARAALQCSWALIPALFAAEWRNSGSGGSRMARRPLGPGDESVRQIRASRSREQTIALRALACPASALLLLGQHGTL